MIKNLANEEFLKGKKPIPTPILIEIIVCAIIKNKDTNLIKQLLHDN